ncbi:OLC1v1010727C1 [Oldenlandia corymbosa var. corymbosa]|uniref:OLC1v1010727C1 n=1 Tax=Oldenlandia corymbosa var. corymbosa TaxID=529605 RepID=A0AAV1DRY3_OLDCO|nr:OLC1v1010727C1 [Oldenlandia corymbosa var. corymbosa]
MAVLGSASARLSTTFEWLTELYIEFDCGDWGFLKDLLEFSPRLQVLNMSKSGWCTWGHDHVSKTCWEEPTDIPGCLLHSLARVSFYGFEGLKRELKLLKYILKHGAVMKTILIGCSKEEKTVQKVEKLRRVPKASPSCEIELSSGARGATWN